MRACGHYTWKLILKVRSKWLKWNTKKTQLSLGKADRTAYVRSPASDFQSRRKNDFSEVIQFYACYVNGTLLSKATVNATITRIWHSCAVAVRGAAFISFHLSSFLSLWTRLYTRQWECPKHCLIAYQERHKNRYLCSIRISQNYVRFSSACKFIR